MWIFTIAPDYVIHLVFAVGVIGMIAGYIVGFIPSMKMYKLAVQIVAILVLSFGLYLEGGLSDYKEWEFKANELQAKISKMETEMAKEDVKIVEKVVNKTQVVREKGKEVIVYVDREVAKYDEKFSANGQCALPSEFFKAYNDSLGKGEK